MIYFLLGLIIGILLRDGQTKNTISNELKQKEFEKGSAQFFESTTFQEKFDKSKNLDDLLV